jgi:hypothetical protein
MIDTKPLWLLVTWNPNDVLHHPAAGVKGTPLGWQMKAKEEENW